MKKKSINTLSITNELKGASLYFAEPQSSPDKKINEKVFHGDSSEKSITSNVTRTNESSRTNPREITRENKLDLPTRNEIQEFCFYLRDEFKVKVQAEVPHQWQDELEEIARQLKVKKLELYRYILGEFLGKIKK